MLSNDRLKYTDKEIIERGSRALIKELGYSGFLRFIRHYEGMSEGDYLELEEEIFKNDSVDKIYDDAEVYWKKNNK